MMRRHHSPPGILCPSAFRSRGQAERPGRERAVRACASVSTARVPPNPAPPRPALRTFRGRRGVPSRGPWLMMYSARRWSAPTWASTRHDSLPAPLMCPSEGRPHAAWLRASEPAASQQPASRPGAANGHPMGRGGMQCTHCWDAIAPLWASGGTQPAPPPSSAL